MFGLKLSSLLCSTILGISTVFSLPTDEQGNTLVKRQTTDRLVFCHFMIGIVGERTGSQDFDDDMKRAKGLGIDAFALNIGVDPYTDTQLGYAYQSAADNDMKVFISFDFNWYHTSDAVAVGQKIAQYAKLPAQLSIRNAAGVQIFWAPNFHPEYGTDFSTVDGALNWIAWPNNGNNKAPTPGHNVTVEAGDSAYVNALNGKAYIAPVSAWFSTHFGPEVPYSKNWVFPSNLLWYDRWNEVLALGPLFLEIITWNDYGESHYIGPLHSPHFDDGNSKWTNDMPHGGWLDMAKPFISAFHAGATSANSFVTTDQLIYWYRPNPRTLNCDATDTTMVQADNSSGNYFMGRPNGWEDMQDSIFVVAMLTQPGTVTVTSGSNTKSFDGPAGISSYTVDMGLGKQQFWLTRNGQTVLSAVSLKDVTSVCPCGIYNFNAYVGTVPNAAPDPLQHDGLASLTAGLHVSTCSATPSLATTTLKPTTTPTGGGSGPTTTSVSSETTGPSSTPASSSTSTSKPTTPTSTTHSTTSSSTTRTSTPSAPPTGTVCIAGTGPGNYVGLCNFCCQYGYCPPGPCTCTATGQQIPPPPQNSPAGRPLPGEDDSYLGLCSYACSHGYCPPTACQQG
ncbi:putative alpha-1,3-glucanase/mutanase [Coniochaeta ligniaria NRRL 30616]|uniref:Putative alpha-1,3-glucanase/mutanase n=1 Tax=Coniochaeta ligniaria NRRL 30616 TaxID=1408157 RepID=A0A1J7IDS6_9PEZI|nr:putative alpha-1,3-glucanase/mutanase [Coniochaeta ligniaria NRRL 30616]